MGVPDANQHVRPWMHDACVDRPPRMGTTKPRVPRQPARPDDLEHTRGCGVGVPRIWILARLASCNSVSCGSSARDRPVVYSTLDGLVRLAVGFEVSVATVFMPPGVRPRWGGEGYSEQQQRNTDDSAQKGTSLSSLPFEKCPAIFFGDLEQLPSAESFPQQRSDHGGAREVVLIRRRFQSVQHPAREAECDEGGVTHIFVLRFVSQPSPSPCWHPLPPLLRIGLLDRSRLPSLR
jgi:hypothetical protein